MSHYTGGERDGSVEPKPFGEWPSCSVVVASCERPIQLVRCLENLARLDYPGWFEVIVAIDGAGSPPEDELRRLGEVLALTTLIAPRAGPAAARNAAAGRAAGELLVFTDDDCAPARDWLRTLAAESVGNPQSLLGGRTMNALQDRYAQTSQMLVDFLYACGNRNGRRVQLIASNNMAMSADAFRRIGGFDESYRCAGGEDRDLCARWFEQGGQIQYLPAAVVHHAHAMTFATFWRQHFDYGRGASLYYRTRSWLDDRQIGHGRLGFYARLFAYPWTGTVGSGRLSSTALIAAAQVATAAGFVWERFIGRAGGQPDGNAP